MHNEEGFIEDTARVISVENNQISFEMINNGSCESCGLHGVCGTNDRSIVHEAYSDLDIEKGDIIKVYLSAGVKILSAFILFLIPILTMIAFYLLGKLVINLSEDMSILLSVFGLLFSGFFIFMIDKKFAKKIHFEVIEIVQKGNNES